ncbi:cysteine hydrolase family protein [Niallia sp. 03133]|uniref:cysteine hydrolase family protein n=1 Tax=Niallia sp. 03133 TaxID=3458060 RepID=UPI004044A11E
MKALINIDYTYDFVKGKLPCGEPAMEIEQEISNITQKFINQGDFAVFAIDLHKKYDPYHPESTLFPPHNIEGTSGRELYGALNKIYKEASMLSNVYWMDKTRYSAFTGTDLHIKLSERNISELYLVGVCTDICLLHTAIDAYNFGYKLFIYENAVASFNQAGHQWALQHFKEVLGAIIL